LFPAVVPFAALSCGGSAPAPQAPAANGSSAPVVVTPPPQVDLSQVPDPPGLVVSGRIGRLNGSFDVVHGWSKLPMPGAEQVTELVTSEAVGPLVDLDQPIDFAVAITGKIPKVDLLAAVSAAVKDPDKTKASLTERYKLVPGANGVIRIQGLGRPKDDGDGDDDGDKGDRRPSGEAERTCELAPAFGAAATRIVCAWSNRALGELGPWLTRTATRAASAADAHVDLRMSPLKDGLAVGASFLQMQVAQELGADGASPGGEALRAGIGDLLLFAKDTDVLSVDLQLAEPGATMTTTLKLASANSEIARVATAHPERNGPAPDAFWQLPRDADAGGFARGVDDADMAKVMGVVLPVLTGLLGDAVTKEAKSVVDAFGKLFSGAPAVYASGLDVEAVRKALAGAVAHAAQPDDAASLEAKHAAKEALIGWHVLERDEPSSRLVAALKDLSVAWSKPAVAAAFRAKNPDALVPQVRAAPLPKGANLPAGSVQYVFEIPSPPPDSPTPPPPASPHDKAKPVTKKPPRPKALAFHLIVAPDGQRTWVGLAGDETLAASRLTASMAGTGDKLGSRGDLGALKQSTLGAGGFVTMRGLGETAALVAVVAGLDSPSEILSMYEEALQLPHQTLSPIPFSITPQPGSPGPVVSTFTLPKGSIEDAVTAVVKHGGF
jgi:hypothetical protein